MIHWAARVTVCTSLWSLGGVCMYKRCLPPFILWCFPQLTYLTTHKRLREDSRRSEKDGRRRSSGFFLLLIAKGKQRRRSESVREKVWSEWSSEKEEERKRKEKTEEPVPRKVCDDKLCALLTLGFCLSWDQHVFELYCCLMWQPELLVCQEKWDRYLMQVRNTDALKYGESKHVRQV